MKFGMLPAPYLRSKRSTKKIMLLVTAGLVIVWIASIIYNFSLRSSYGEQAIIIGLIALITTFLLDAIWAFFKLRPAFQKQKKFDLKIFLKEILHSYSYVTALIFALTVPVGTPIFVVVLGAVVSTAVGKMIFGGFGFNIVNPAAVGRIVVGLAYPSTLVHYMRDTHIGSVVAGATPTSSMATNWFSTQLPEGIDSIGQLFIGNYSGALGETFTLLLFAIAIVFCVLRVIDWRIPTFYLGTIIVSAIAVALFKQLNVLDYVLIHLAIGGSAFAAVFMLTDPVTSPTSPYGKIIFAIGAGLITFLIRVSGATPEGVIFSIAVMNLSVPLIDRYIKGRTTDHLKRKAIVTAALLLFAALFNVGIIYLKEHAGGDSIAYNAYHLIEMPNLTEGILLEGVMIP